jgi:putative holliday junction resolvase
MRVLSIDYGLRRIGLALSDPTGLFAQGLGVLQRVSDKGAVADIAKIVLEKEVDEIVVGLPKNMNGTIGPRAEQCKAFADKLGESVSIPIAMYDERLTTVAATRVLIDADMRRNKRKRVVDEIAATILLQNYLDYKRSTQG